MEVNLGQTGQFTIDNKDWEDKQHQSKHRDICFDIIKLHR